MNIVLTIWLLCWSTILFTYIFFPLVLALCVHARRIFASPAINSETINSEIKASQSIVVEENLQAKSEEWPHISMVIAAYNEAAVLAKKLENIRLLDYPSDRLTIHIGSDGSDDGTAELLQNMSDPRLHVHLFTERRGKISVLNDLVRDVEEEIIVFSDANTMYAPDALQRMMPHFADPRVGCVSGELRLEKAGGVSGEGLYWRYECWIKRQESKLGFLIGCNGGIFAIRKALYSTLPSWTIVEDFVITMRVLRQGSIVRYVPEAHASEPPCATSRAEMVRKIRIGAGNFQALLMTRDMLHPRYGLQAFAYLGHKVLRWLVPIFFLIAFAANIALAASLPFMLLLICEAAGGCIAVWAYNLTPGTESPRWTRPISYFYLMNYALFCGLVRILLGKQKVTWERPALQLPVQEAGI